MKTKKFEQLMKTMEVEKWEIREFSNGKRKVYAQFVPKKPQVEVVVKENWTTEYTEHTEFLTVQNV